MATEIFISMLVSTQDWWKTPTHQFPFSEGKKKCVKVIYSKDKGFCHILCEHLLNVVPSYKKSLTHHYRTHNDTEVHTEAEESLYERR